MRLLVLVTLPLIYSHGVKGNGSALFNAHLTLWRRLLLWRGGDMEGLNDGVIGVGALGST